MPTLRELTQQQQELIRLDDLPEEVLRDTLEALGGEIDIKAESLAHVILELDAQELALDGEIKRLTARKKTARGRGAWLRGYLKDHMARAGRLKIERPWFTIAVRANPPAVRIDAEHLIPAEFFDTPKPVPSKARIADALKDGHAVPGAALDASTRLDIR